MEAKVIEKFTPELVTAICDCIQSVADECLAKGLISGDFRTDIQESSVAGKDKARKLVTAVKNCAEIDSVSFDIFLRILNVTLPERIKSKLLADMRAELTSNTCMALIPRGLGLSSVNHGYQFAIATTQSANDISRQIIQEQNPYIGRLEETNRELERVVVEKRLLKKKLEENERLEVPLTTGGEPSLQMSSSNSVNYQSAMFQADILGLKAKIEELEKRSTQLEMTIKRSRSAIDVKVERIAQNLVQAQRNLELRYEQQLQQGRKNEHEWDSDEEFYDDEGADSAQAGYGQHNGTKSVDSPSPAEQPNRPLLRDIILANANFEGRYRVEGKWEEIGIVLGVDAGLLRSIRITNCGSDLRSPTNDIAFRDMFSAWLKQENPSPTWLIFVNALEQLKLQKYADHLRLKYCQSDDSAPDQALNNPRN